MITIFLTSYDTSFSLRSNSLTHAVKAVRKWSRERCKEFWCQASQAVLRDWPKWRKHLRMPSIKSQSLKCSGEKKLKRKTKKTNKSAPGDGAEAAVPGNKPYFGYFMWAWPFDNRYAWDSLHRLHFYLSQRSCIKNLEEEGKGWRDWVFIAA